MTFTARTFATLTLIFMLLTATASAQSYIWRPELYGCVVGSQTRAVVDTRDYLVKTRDAALDSDIEDEMTTLNSLFGVQVAIYFPNDGLKSAYFTHEKHDKLLKRDDVPPEMYEYITGSIFIGMGLLDDEYHNYGSLMSVPGILAHEYAHAMQYQNKFPYPKSLRSEQHADFMTGWYIAYRCQCRVQDPRVALDSIARKGDRTGYFDSGIHGTSEQRASAFMAGYYYFQQGGRDAMSAYRYALGVVTSSGE
jgi:uncharacterized protein (DUF2164 family)